jgi:hypothetical protein
VYSAGPDGQPDTADDIGNPMPPTRPTTAPARVRGAAAGQQNDLPRLKELAKGKDKVMALFAVDALHATAFDNNNEKAREVAVFFDELVTNTTLDPEVRNSVADHLGSLAKILKPPQPWPGLLKVATDAAAPAELRSRIFDALGNIPRTDALEPILTGMLDKDLSVRQAAFNSWVKIIGVTPPAAPRPADPNTRVPAIPAEKTYEPRSNPNKAFVDDVTANLDQWKHYVEAVNKRLDR